MGNFGKPKLVGLNHAALEVGDIDEALAFYGAIFDFELRGRGPGRAFLDMGDQFLVLMETTHVHDDDVEVRHFGLVVDDRERLRELALDAGAMLVPDAPYDFLDPWANRIQVVAYRDVQFTKGPAVLGAMGLQLDKSEEARAELADKGMAGA
jgi:catechol 2,3-dioxygenase-like lactoylglutathione lyase family enzyme